MEFLLLSLSKEEDEEEIGTVSKVIYVVGRLSDLHTLVEMRGCIK